MTLTKYKEKRNFNETSEPVAKEKKSQKELVFVIQRHQASHLHYDFRLEMEGVLKSWAVPKGPSLNPKDKRLAMMVEDHPYDYRNFEGTIPEGNYGAGVVEIWDEGTYEHIEIKNRKEGEKQLLHDLAEGSIKIVMHGNKLKGEFALVKLKGSGNGRPENSWLLIKHNDEFAVQTTYNSEEYTDPDSEVSAEVERRTGKKVKLAKSVSSKEKVTQPESEPKKRNYRTALAGLRTEKKLTDVITPMLAKQGENAFSDEDWVFEIKWDGYRAVAECKKEDIRLYSRNGLSFMHKYENVVAALQELKLDAVLDGEVVVLDQEAKPNFQFLQHYPDVPEGCTLMYYVFDILEHKGKSLVKLPLLERKAILKKLLPQDFIVRYCDHVEKGGLEFFNWVTEKGLEGMMAKKADSLYYPGKRTTEWRKIRNHNMQEVVIGGFTEPQGGRKHFGSLVLGMYEGDRFIYVGNVGTGFDDKVLKELYDQMISLKLDKSPFADKVKDVKKVTFVKPELVANIKFTEWTEERSLRHPVFMGLRVDKTAKEVQYNNETAAVNAAATEKVKEPKPEKVNAKPVLKEEPVKKEAKKSKSASKETIVTVEGKEVKLTNQTKIYFPDDNVTKGDVVKYYQSVAEYILPYLKDRPQSLKRNPNGIKDNGFFHKDAGDEAPDWAESIPLYSDSAHKEIDYLLCNDKATLMYMNNLGCIEINPWNSRKGSLENPDWMVIDIDPSDKNTFEQVIECALVTKAVLDKAGAESYCKTSGATGLHVYVPMGAKYTYEQVKNFANIIASMVQEQIPEFTTLERPLKKRKDRIYVDYLQNREGQTLAAAYSLRPKKGATVSTPLEWKEVKKGLSPSQFTIFNIMARIKKKGDLFKGVLGKGIDMEDCLKKLSE